MPAGSYLAVVDHGPNALYDRSDGRSRSSQRLVLISPSGETQDVYQRRVVRKYGGFSLLDWSVDGQTALLTAIEHDATQLIRVDVATGAVSELPVKLLNSAVLDADGTGVLATTWTSRSERHAGALPDLVDGDRIRLLDSINGAWCSAATAPYRDRRRAARPGPVLLSTDRPARCVPRPSAATATATRCGGGTTTRLLEMVRRTQ